MAEPSRSFIVYRESTVFGNGVELPPAPPPPPNQLYRLPHSGAPPARLPSRLHNRLFTSPQALCQTAPRPAAAAAAAAAPSLCRQDGSAVEAEERRAMEAAHHPTATGPNPHRIRDSRVCGVLGGAPHRGHRGGVEGLLLACARGDARRVHGGDPALPRLPRPSRHERRSPRKDGDVPPLSSPRLAPPLSSRPHSLLSPHQVTLLHQ